MIAPSASLKEDRPMAPVNPNFLAALPGISGILVTPFDRDDQIAPHLLKPIIDRAIGAGVHILTVNGNTGEFYSLTTAEAERMVHLVAEQVDGRAPLLAGVGRSIGDAVALARASRQAGAAALMVHQPPDPFVAPRGVVAYVQRIAEARQGLPVVLYLRNDGIGFVKWASPTPLRLAEAFRRADPRIVWVGGLAEVWAPPLCAVGARGFTSGLIDVWPEHSMAIHAALASGNYPQANALIRTMNSFEELRAEENNGTNVTVVKSALRLMGQDCGHVRPPGAWPLTERQTKELSSLLNEWGLTSGARVATGGD
jgi:4-hydroxy-tetrahydrodipicolinate synthase